MEVRLITQNNYIKRGVEVVNRAKVCSAGGGIVALTNGNKIRADTLIWSAGGAANPQISSLSVPQRDGRIVVDAFLEVEGGRAHGRWAIVPW